MPPPGFEPEEDGPLAPLVVATSRVQIRSASFLRLLTSFVASEYAASRTRSRSVPPEKPPGEQRQHDGRTPARWTHGAGATARAPTGTITFLTLHQDDIGENYEAVRDLLIEVVADGLVTE